MRQIRIFSDSRLKTQCAYCGNQPENKDYVPSKIILEKPYPDNLPVVPSCLECNKGFSLDEEYFACLIECIICGTTEPENLIRTRILKILERKPKLRDRLAESVVIENGKTLFRIEIERVENVFSKLAYGHAKFENGVTIFQKPTSISYVPLELLTEKQMEDFFSANGLEVAPEIDSRAMMNSHFVNGIPISNWTTVQDGVYEYSVIVTLRDLKVRILIWDYLAYEIVWN